MTFTPASITSAAAHEVAALVRSGRLCLTTHVNPDGDGLGSEVALVHILRAQGIDAIITNPSTTPDRFGFLLADLPGVDRSAQGVKELRRADAILVLDIADLGRLGMLAESVRERGVPVGCIDHHASVGALPPGPRYVDVSAAATGELIFLLAQELGWSVPLEAARALYVALVTDTGGFRFSNTRPRTLQIASELLALGVDTEQVYLDVYAGAPIGRPRLLAEVLQTLVVEDPIGLAWVTVPPGGAGTSRRRRRRCRRDRRACPFDPRRTAGDALPRNFRGPREGLASERGHGGRGRTGEAVRWRWPHQGRGGCDPGNSGGCASGGARRCPEPAWRVGSPCMPCGAR